MFSIELILVNLQASSVLLYYKKISPQIAFGICTYSYLSQETIWRKKSMVNQRFNEFGAFYYTALNFIKKRGLCCTSL